jgi:DNA-binding MarR family transcriptional regulator
LGDNRMTIQTGDDRAELVACLHQLVSAARQDYRLREQATGASMAVMRVATAIAAQPGIGPSALAEVLRLDRSTVSNLLRDMQEAGLIRRQRLRTDRRSVSLGLTARGRALALRSGRPGTGLLSRAVACLKDDQVARLTLGLEPLLLALHGDPSPPSPGP